VTENALLDRIADAENPAELLDACAHIEAEISQYRNGDGQYFAEMSARRAVQIGPIFARAIASGDIAAPPRRDMEPSARISVRSVSDGSFLLDGGAVFGPVPRSIWQKIAHPDRQSRVRLGLNSLLVKAGQSVILVNAGIGSREPSITREVYGHSSSKLARDIRIRTGLNTRSVTHVVLTDLAFFHSAGATKLDREGSLTPAFPRARYLVQRAAWEDAFNPDERAVPLLGPGPEHLLDLQERGRLELLDGDSEVVPGVRLFSTGGFSNGHQAVLVTAGSERILYPGGLIPTPAHVNPAFISSLDHDPVRSLAAKRELLAAAEREGWLVVFPQGYQQTAAYIERRSGAISLRPVAL
jgi:glyoxylase-like metal-dependent hydrolase (beta-lactamase superfamily II)